MRFPFALLTIGAILTGQLDSTPLSTENPLGENPFREGNAKLNKLLDSVGDTVLDLPVTVCTKLLARLDVIQACKDKVGTMKPFTTEVPLGNKSSVAEHLAVCDELIQIAECINEEACNFCTDYEEVLRIGDDWFDPSLENTMAIGCRETGKPKCQTDVIEKHYKEMLEEEEEDTEGTELSGTSITIMVVISLTFILVGILLYCIFFGPSGEEGADEGKSAKEGVSEGKGAKSVSAKSASAPKSTKIGEASTKSKLPSVAKSAVKSAISAGVKSKVKSTVADTKTASKVSSKGKV